MLGFDDVCVAQQLRVVAGKRSVHDLDELITQARTRYMLSLPQVMQWMDRIVAPSASLLEMCGDMDRKSDNGCVAYLTQLYHQQDMDKTVLKQAVRKWIERKQFVTVSSIYLVDCETVLAVNRDLQNGAEGAEGGGET